MNKNTLNFDSLYTPYASKRFTTYANKGMVATSQSLASQSGIDILKKGGNAVDAAIATAACLTVVEPTSNGIGGDAFAIVWMKNNIYGLNASGPAPKGISVEEVKKLGHNKMPKHGMIPVTVPGAPAGWAELSKRFGALPFEELLKPAIKYAEEGFPVSPIVAKNWRKKFYDYKELFKDDIYNEWFKVFTINGAYPEAGQIWKSQDHANTLKEIAKTKAESFYRGGLAKSISSFFKTHHGFLDENDLSSYEPEWVNPISINYRGYDVWEIPPNGQGINALMALNILKGFNLIHKESIDTYHKKIEAMKLAFTDGQHYVTDLEHMDVQIENLLSDSYASKRRELIKDTAITPTIGRPQSGGTVYLATADSEGNMVSFIQSNYDAFGSGVVVPNTGIALQNRGGDFSLDTNDANALEPGKKSYHTIIPGFLSKQNKPVGPFGVMAGYMQPQAHMQIVSSMIDFNLNPQSALDAPRWKWVENKNIQVEPEFSDQIAQALERKGHKVEKSLDESGFGRGQIIIRDAETGVLMGGTEGRSDGNISVW